MEKEHLGAISDMDLKRLLKEEMPSTGNAYYINIKIPGIYYTTIVLTAALVSLTAGIIRLMNHFKTAIRTLVNIIFYSSTYFKNNQVILIRY